VSKVSAVTEGGEDVRSVTLTAHGEFLIHGRKTNKDAKLTVKLHFPTGAAADSIPTSIVVKSVEPLRIVRAEHQVRAMKGGRS
jgi:hypothetical protein